MTLADAVAGSEACCIRPSFGRHGHC